MTKAEALELLLKLADDSDAEGAHYQADQILLRLIDDPEITKAFMDLERWYA